MGASLRPENLKTCIKFNWNFQRGGGLLEKISLVGEAWMFTETTQRHISNSYWMDNLIDIFFIKLLSNSNQFPIL